MSMHHSRRNYWQVKFPSFLYIYFACLKRRKKREGISSVLPLKTACITYEQMKWGTRQHSSRLLWHQQSLVQLFTLTMGSTQWDLHLTAPYFIHMSTFQLNVVQLGLYRSSTSRSEQGSQILELVWRMVDFADSVFFVLINLDCQLPVRNRNCNRLQSPGLCNALMQI